MWALALLAMLAQDVPPTRPTAELIGVVVADTSIYADEKWFMIPPGFAAMLVLPRGDTVVFANAVRWAPPVSDGCPRDAATIIAIIAWGDTLRSEHELLRGEPRRFFSWAAVLPSGDTLRVRELYRRKVECDESDGGVVMWFRVRRGL